MKKTVFHSILLCSFLLILTACSGGKDYAYVSDTESHSGPGLISGEDGVFHLIEYQKKGEDDIEEEKTAEAVTEPEK